MALNNTFTSIGRMIVDDSGRMNEEMVLVVSRYCSSICLKELKKLEEPSLLVLRF
jgi:hypothetical protein